MRGVRLCNRELIILFSVGTACGLRVYRNQLSFSTKVGNT